MVLLWYRGTGTSIGNLSYTWDANKNKTSEGFGGTMSGYGFTSQSRVINFRSRIAHTFDASTPCSISSIADEFSLESSLHLTTDTSPLSNASYLDEPVVRKPAGTDGTIHYYHRNGQYSITAMTTSTGAVAERYAYTAYGQPTIASASGSVLKSSAIGKGYTHTGREWDETLDLHHFRSRWMSPLAGRFLGRDPIGYEGGQIGLYSFLRGMPLSKRDSTGLIDFGCDQKFHDCNEEAEDLLQACLDAGWGRLCYPGYNANLSECITMDLACKAAETANDSARFCLIYRRRCVMVGGVLVIGGAVAVVEPTPAG